MTGVEIDAMLGLDDSGTKSKSGKESTAPKPEYAFGLDREGLIQASELVKLDPAELVESLRQISYDRLTPERARVPYLEIRSEVCAINIALNLQGVIAPVYREMRRPKNVKKKLGAFTTEDELISNDRQVFDLHWIYVNKLPVNRVIGYAHLFERSEFDWDLASQFAVKAGKRNTKAEHLGLPEFHEMQLCAIRSLTTIARQQTIDNRIKKTLKDIKAYLTNSSSRYDGDVLANADRLYRSMLVARSNTRNALVAYKQMTGEEVSASRMRRLIATFHAVAGTRGHPTMAE